jgi:hypothetical protein
MVLLPLSESDSRARSLRSYPPAYLHESPMTASMKRFFSVIVEVAAAEATRCLIVRIRGVFRIHPRESRLERRRLIMYLHGAFGPSIVCSHSL